MKMKDERRILLSSFILFYVFFHHFKKFHSLALVLFFHILECMDQQYFLSFQFYMEAQHMIRNFLF